MTVARSACLLPALLLLLGSVPAVARAEDSRQLVLTQSLGEAGATPAASAPARSGTREGLPLRLTHAVLAEGQRHPETIAGSGLSGKFAGSWQRDALLTLLSLISVATLLDILSGWLTSLRRKADRPLQPAVMLHANWPVVSVLVIPRGEPHSRIELIRELGTIDFDYPAERIHFVVAHTEGDPTQAMAVADLHRARDGRVQALPCPDENLPALPELLDDALSRSAGDALVLLDQDLPVPRHWLRSAVSPLLDPATALVVGRCVRLSAANLTRERIDMLAARADLRTLTQADALAQLLAGKACIRALRRQAMRALPPAAGLHSEAGIAIELARQGWQAALLDGLSLCHDTPDSRHSVSLRFITALRCLGLFTGFLKPRFPVMARRQIRTALGMSIRMLGWQALFLCGVALYYSGEPLAAGLAVMLCALMAFDPHGIPDSALRTGVLLHDGVLREESRLLALMPLSHLARQIEGLMPSWRRQARQKQPQPDSPTTQPVESC